VLWSFTSSKKKVKKICVASQFLTTLQIGHWSLSCSLCILGS
jgi:hypothetical protein